MADYKATDRVIEAVRRALGGDRQFELGRLLVAEADKRGAKTADLRRIAEQAGASLRTIQYAVKVYRFAARVGLSEADVAQIGRTKLALVTSGIGGDHTKDAVMALCEGRSVAGVRAAVAGLTGSITVVPFALNKTQRQQLEAALIRHGAVRKGRGLSGKEAALMKIVSKIGQL